MKKVGQVAIFVSMFALIIAAGLLTKNFYSQPIAEGMDIEVAETTAVSPASIQQPAAQAPKGVCGNTGVIRILFIGADFSMGNPPYGADAIRMMKVDFDNKKITSVAFPRDLVVDAAALADIGHARTPIGLAYYYRREATAGENKHRITKATETIAQILYDDFAYPAQEKDYYYLTLQLNEVGAMVDAVGGVEVNLPESIITERNVTFPAGPQVLDGTSSVEYLRAVQPGGDSARLQRQNLYATGLQKKVMDISILAKVPDLYKRFDKAVVTDLSPKQIEALACMSKEVSQDQEAFYHISGDLVTISPHGEMIPDVEKIKAKLKEWFGE